MKPKNELAPFRARIDAIDDALLSLLSERAEVAIAVGRVKKKAGTAVLHDAERERAVIARLVKKGAGRFPKDAIRTLFREVMSACLSLEESLRVAYLGPEGTFSHMAVRKAFGLSATYVECATIEGVFDAVSAGEATYGVVPVENSTEGSVPAAVDGLIEGHLFVKDELVLDVEQCLLSRSKSLARVTRVFSHAQALGQCRKFLAKNLPHALVVQTSSTAQAAREAHADERAAAIGSALAGELYGLPVLRSHVQDHAENATRFFVVAKTDAPRTGDDKTSVAFSVREARGALRRVLSVFEENGVNLSRIESRPSKKTRWDYVFFVDLDGHKTDENVARALAAAKRSCHTLRVLGSYPRFTGTARPATAAGAKQARAR
jgi:chorismate mutase/prephenate dehydratase